MKLRDDNKAKRAFSPPIAQLGQDGGGFPTTRAMGYLLAQLGGCMATLSLLFFPFR
jgi:hypothetical protein